MSLQIPSHRVTATRPVLAAAKALVRSPFTLTGQVQDWGGRVWKTDLEFALHGEVDGRRLAAFFNRVTDGDGTFLWRGRDLARPDLSEAVTVRGGGQTGRSLNTAGWGATGLRAGDWFSLGSGAATRLYQLTADVVPVAGLATLQFVPALRSAPLNGAVVEVAAPALRLRCEVEIPAEIGLAQIYRFSVSAVEAI